MIPSPSWYIDLFDYKLWKQGAQILLAETPIFIIKIQTKCTGDLMGKNLVYKQLPGTHLTVNRGLSREVVKNTNSNHQIQQSHLLEKKSSCLHINYFFFKHKKYGLFFIHFHCSSVILTSLTNPMTHLIGISWRLTENNDSNHQTQQFLRPKHYFFHTYTQAFSTPSVYEQSKDIFSLGRYVMITTFLFQLHICSQFHNHLTPRLLIKE